MNNDKLLRYAVWLFIISVFNYSFPLAFWWEDTFVSAVLSAAFIWGFDTDA